MQNSCYLEEKTWLPHGNISARLIALRGLIIYMLYMYILYKYSHIGAYICICCIYKMHQIFIFYAFKSDSLEPLWPHYYKVQE